MTDTAPAPAQLQVKDADSIGSEKELDRYKGRPDKSIAVMEIFGPTIQGEGAMIGVRTMFVRFGGCDYRCAKCDSLHAVMPQAVKKNAQWMNQENIFDHLNEQYQKTGCDWVTLSGGNPVMWDLTFLVEMLQDAGIKVAVETQGTIYRPWVAQCDQITISPKSPGMGEKFEEPKFRSFLNRALFETDGRGLNHSKTCIKVPVFSQQDLEFCAGLDSMIDFIAGEDPVVKYMSLGNSYPPALDAETGWQLLKPEHHLVSELLNDFGILLEDFLQDGRLQDWRFTPQLHVLVWGNKAGV